MSEWDFQVEFYRNIFKMSTKNIIFYIKLIIIKEDLSDENGTRKKNGFRIQKTAGKREAGGKIFFGQKKQSKKEELFHGEEGKKPVKKRCPQEKEKCPERKNKDGK